ncbi:DUF1473 family protein [Borrelia miyamotoi]|uniref:DUF1473 family protein n=1 Tax=Borrelia miyamotoi TaxID=47466 RepID=A0A0X9K070_9SPIR|nr:DUF1473 family protein [Borrelia miyamotoi]ALU64341.1 hypothetical protein I871_E0005 [Borrelia miyamotoi]AOW96272.1 hypothetical protein AXH25_05990 [Borrelia miyamotoi]QTL84366.1 DUF1473 family protein [Borrelia miyamotoi]WAZ85971.1 DUF1473 family protein [Borrelia miyamotoi]WAZ91752.1 DUF1473 family protein [Borrelia miyamotoi]
MQILNKDTNLPVSIKSTLNLPIRLYIKIFAKCKDIKKLNAIKYLIEITNLVIKHDCLDEFYLILDIIGVKYEFIHITLPKDLLRKHLYILYTTIIKRL